MARELHSDQLPKTEQMPPIFDTDAYDGDTVLIDPGLAAKDYLDELKFMDEAVTIRLEPSTDKNASNAFPVWINGIPAQVFMGGAWREVGYLPVARELVVKRKVLEVILRAKTDSIRTEILDRDSERPNNVIQRYTSPIHSLSILEDRNPRGAAWASEMRRRNF